MDFKALTSLTEMFFQMAERLGDKPFLWRKADQQWRPLSWAEVSRTVVQLAHGLKAQGLRSGDRVLLVSENRPEWLISDLAIMAAGGITVPAYTTNTVADHLHLLNNSGARLAVVSTRALAERLLTAALQADHQPTVIAIDPLGLAQNPGIELCQWKDLLAADAPAAPPVRPKRTDTACVIYTSGTGGAPKGVMLSHGAIICNCMGAYHLLETIGLNDEIFLSFLPLSHSYEHTAGQFFPISIGAQIYYAEGLEYLAANMAEVHPTIMTAVPRLYDLMRGRILKSVDKAGRLEAALFRLALETGTRRIEGDHLSLWRKLLDLLLSLTVRRKVANRFGGRLKAMVSGGAPLNYDVGLFFTALGVPILQGYGQTESAPVISCNPPLRVKLHTVGPAVADLDVRIAADGEICVRGESVMQGYWNNPEATADVIKDGWLHTGDIGVIDEDGYIRITDRKKDILVNSGGDNISPQRIEGFLTLQPEIAQAMVYGDHRPHLVALIVPDAEQAAAWAQDNGKPAALAELVQDAAFRRHVGVALDRVNRNLSAIEKVRRFMLIAEPFTVDNEMCTPTLKIRRHVINARYGAGLAALYEDKKG